MINCHNEQWYMTDCHPSVKITDWPTTLLEMYGARGQIGTTVPHSDSATLRHQYSTTSIATLWVLSCLHSPGLHCPLYIYIYTQTQRHNYKKFIYIWCVIYCDMNKKCFFLYCAHFWGLWSAITSIDYSKKLFYNFSLQLLSTIPSYRYLLLLSIMRKNSTLQEVTVCIH